jgi:hypothetical protein
MWDELFSLMVPNFLCCPCAMGNLGCITVAQNQKTAAFSGKTYFDGTKLPSVVMRAQNHNRWYEFVFSRVFNVSEAHPSRLTLSAGRGIVRA